MDLESQIQQALQQAELFSKSLESARLQEAKALQTLENERVKWSQDSEEKSIYIDQLQRELEATVDALHSSKLEDNITMPVEQNHNENSARLNIYRFVEQSLPDNSSGSHPYENNHTQYKVNHTDSQFFNNDVSVKVLFTCQI